jgi:hypothetical protein
MSDHSRSEKIDRFLVQLHLKSIKQDGLHIVSEARSIQG